MRRYLKSLASTALILFPKPRDPAHSGPGLHLRWRLGWVRGKIFLFSCFLRSALGGTKIQVGKRFSIQGALRIRGPGTVLIGDDVIIDSRTDIFTHSPQAVVLIGDRSFLNGTRMGCSSRIEIGEEAIVSDARIMDTDFHSLTKFRRFKTAPILTRPVIVARNVWIGAGAAILKGVTIGENSVIAFGSVVTKDIPANVIAAGNPCKEIGPLPE